MSGGVATGVPKKVEAVVRRVRTIHQEVEMVIAVEIHGEGRRPQPDGEVHGKSGVVIMDRFECEGWE